MDITSKYKVISPTFFAEFPWLGSSLDASLWTRFTLGQPVDAQEAEPGHAAGITCPS